MLRIAVTLGAMLLAGSAFQLAQPQAVAPARMSRLVPAGVAPVLPRTDRPMVLPPPSFPVSGNLSRTPRKVASRVALPGPVVKYRRAVTPILALPRVLPGRAARVPILMYHHVSSAVAATPLNYSLTVTDADFGAQLHYLRAHGYHPVLLTQVFAALYQNKPLPSRPIVLTFDDGYSDNFTEALPLLRQYHMAGEFNIISAYVGITLGVNRYMNWPQLKALVAAGMEIGSHTVDHQDLGLLPETKIRFELRDSRSVLQRKLGVPVQFLAYPAGQPIARGNADQVREVLRLLPQYGYVGALCDGPWDSSLQHASSPYTLWRIRVAGGESLSAFAGSLPA